MVRIKPILAAHKPPPEHDHFDSAQWTVQSPPNQSVSSFQLAPLWDRAAHISAKIINSSTWGPSLSYLWQSAPSNSSRFISHNDPLLLLLLTVSIRLGPNIENDLLRNTFLQQSPSSVSVFVFVCASGELSIKRFAGIMDETRTRAVHVVKAP